MDQETQNKTPETMEQVWDKLVDYVEARLRSERAFNHAVLAELVAHITEQTKPARKSVSKRRAQGSHARSDR